jgi:hypothetical protein
LEKVHKSGRSLLRGWWCPVGTYVRLKFSRPWLWRISSYGMLRRLVLVTTDVSEERVASIMVTIIDEIGTLAVTSHRSKLQRKSSISSMRHVA